MASLHTVVLSDIHLADAEPADPARPLWRRYLRAEHFPDESLLRFLGHLRGLTHGEPCALVLNGDIFDFDVVKAVPDEAAQDALGLTVGWLETARGLHPEEPKSEWKMRRILAAHPTLLAGLRDFVHEGNDLVFVFGNHDLELHWPAVQDALLGALGVCEERQHAVRICEWFYRAGDDTLVTHGNQLDPYCLTLDPLHPTIEVLGTPRIRLPFGDQAARYLLNGMGWFNAHVEETFSRSFAAWVRFFLSVVARQQPLLLFTWLWSALAALVVTLTEAARPARRDARSLEVRLEAVAERARATPGMVMALRELRAHPATARPWTLAKELWLDRALLLLLVVVGSFQIIASLHLLAGINPAWVSLAFGLLLVPFFAYSATVRSDKTEVRRLIDTHLETLCEIARVDRVVMGHTHKATQTHRLGASYFNTGHWAPGFHDLACTKPHGVRVFVWVRPSEVGKRGAELRRWLDPGSVCLGRDGQVLDPRAGQAPAELEQVA